MTQRATRKDTIQSTSPCTVLAALSAIFSTISFPSVIQSRIEFRRTPPTPRPPAGRNKCTYCSIMRPGIVAGQKFPEKIEHNVHIPFSQDRDRASGYGRTHKCGSERSRNRSDRPLCAECSIVCCVETLEYLFILSLSLSLSLSFSFYFHCSRTSNHTDRSSTSTRWISLARDPGERRCPAARIPEGDFQQSNVGIVSTVREIASLTAVFFLALPACFRFHPRRHPIISSFSVRHGDGRARSRDGIGKDNPGALGVRGAMKPNSPRARPASL